MKLIFLFLISLFACSIFTSCQSDPAPVNATKQVVPPANNNGSTSNGRTESIIKKIEEANANSINKITIKPTATQQKTTSAPPAIKRAEKRKVEMKPVENQRKLKLTRGKNVSKIDTAALNKKIRALKLKRGERQKN